VSSTMTRKGEKRSGVDTGPRTGVNFANAKLDHGALGTILPACKPVISIPRLHVASLVSCESEIADFVVQSDACGTKSSLCVENDAVHLSELQYCDVTIKGMSEPVVALKDSGAQISLVKVDLISDLNLPKLGFIAIRGVIGDSVDAALVQLKIKPSPDMKISHHT